MRSACMIVLTRWATIHRSVAGALLQGDAQARVGSGIQRRETVIEEIDTRLLHQRPRDREPLTLTAETLVPPWSMAASRAPGIAATKSFAWAISRACQSSSSVAAGRPKRRLLATVPLKR